MEKDGDLVRIWRRALEAGGEEGRIMVIQEVVGGA